MYEEFLFLVLMSEKKNYLQKSPALRRLEEPPKLFFI